jgi:hypothetical protein
VNWGNDGSIGLSQNPDVLHFENTSIHGELALGNRWQQGSTVIGIEWFGLMVSQKEIDHKEPSLSGTETQIAQKKRDIDFGRSLLAAPNWSLLMFQLGFCF